MKCGFCQQESVAWIEWPTKGGADSKGSMVCRDHLRGAQERWARVPHWVHADLSVTLH